MCVYVCIYVEISECAWYETLRVTTMCESTYDTSTEPGSVPHHLCHAVR